MRDGESRARLVVALALVAMFASTGCVNHYRYLNNPRQIAEWKLERETYPRVVKKTDENFAPSRAASIDIYYAKVPRHLGVEQERFELGPRGLEGKAPKNLVHLARLEVFRGPLPDHGGAVRELQKHGAAVGADFLTDVGYTVVIGKRSVGGGQLMGWIYHAEAKRLPVDERAGP